MKQTLNKLLVALLLTAGVLSTPVFAGGKDLGDALSGAAKVDGGGGGGQGQQDPVMQELAQEYKQDVQQDQQKIEKEGLRVVMDQKECKRWLSRDVNGLQSRMDQAAVIKKHNLERYKLELLATPELTQLGQLAVNRTRDFDWAYGCISEYITKQSRGMWTVGRQMPSIESYRRWSSKWWGLTYPSLMRGLEILDGYYARADQGMPPFIIPGSPRPTTDAEAQKLAGLMQRELREALVSYPFNDPKWLNVESAEKAAADQRASRATANEFNNVR